MKSKSFSTKNDKKLIEMIRNHPVLYKSSDRNYKDNNLKENVWNEISNSIGKNGKSKKLILCVYSIIQLFY